MNRAHSRSRLKNPDEFTPSILFGASEQGVWYDPSDLSTMFQDSAGTTPVTAADQPVGLIKDKSGRGNDASQSAAANRPALRNTGGLWWLEFDGVDDFLVTGSIDFTVTSAMSVFAGMRKSSDVALGIVIELSASPATNGIIGIYAPNGAGQAGIGFRSRGTADSFAASPMTFPAPITLITTMMGDIPTDLLTGRLNGVQVASGAADQGIGTYSNNPLYIGRRGGTSAPVNGNLYGLIVRGAQTSSASVNDVEIYLANKSGVAL